MKNYKIIEIEWLDSLHQSGWLDKEDIKLTNFKDMTHHTVGYLFSQDKKSILVIQSYNKNQADSIMEIPKKAILKISVKKLL